MVWFWIIAAVTLLSFGLEYYLSYRRNKWYGVILPVVYFCAASVFIALNLLQAFPATEAFGSFLTDYGNTGFFALVLKIGFIYTPAALHLMIDLVRRHFYNKAHDPAGRSREYNRMLADDL